MSIKLNFINRSNDRNNAQILIFQKNAASHTGEENPVAWTVIKYCGAGDNHPFSYSLAMQVSACDSWGNYTPQLDAESGQSFAMQQDASGDALVARGPASSPMEVQVRNDLAKGAIGALLYRSSKLVARLDNLVPGQQASFALQPTLWIGVAAGVEEGELLPLAVVADINTQLNLLGVASANIVMTGGGSGVDALPFEFHLEDVLYA